MALTGFVAQWIFRAMNHLILGLSFAETCPIFLVTDCQDLSYHGQGLWLKGLTRGEKKKHSVTTTTVQKESKEGLGLGCLFFAHLFSSVLALDGEQLHARLGAWPQLRYALLGLDSWKG